MAALTENSKRDFGVNTDPMGNDLPLGATVVAFEGAAMESEAGFLFPAGTGGGATERFAGFAQRKADNTAGADGDLTVRVQERGTVELPVTGVVAATPTSTPVYAGSDNDFTLTASGFAVPIGTVRRYVEDGTAIVAFESAALVGTAAPVAPVA